MRFTVVTSSASIPHNAMSEAFLIVDNWNDWFEFQTQYYLIVYGEDGQRFEIGAVKIGQFGMLKDQSRPAIPSSFEVLSEAFFSLGQADDYYINLNQLKASIGGEILGRLRDVAFDNDLFAQALSEKVTGVSLLRSVSRSTVLGQFSRLAHGMARLSEYSFVYRVPSGEHSGAAEIDLSFAVVPDSMPPTNIHVLIGRNGVGKTRLLNNMARCLVESRDGEIMDGRFESLLGSSEGHDMFANLVSVTFSAFDNFERVPTPQNKAVGIQYKYIGLKKIENAKEGKPMAPKTPHGLSRDFSISMQSCRQDARLERWRRALSKLESDPIFRDANIVRLAEKSSEIEDAKLEARRVFKDLSSGHKIVLLTITQLVEMVEEKSLVLLDEPEAHLHPPLLSAFLRAVSELLVNRNGVAIIATHSPVVLQEVPAKCVWKLRRSGTSIQAERPEIETFGENVGVLTREVFGLEVTQSGFHTLLKRSIQPNDSFQDVLAKFGGELGAEARTIVQAILLNPDTTPTSEC